MTYFHARIFIITIIHTILYICSTHWTGVKVGELGCGGGREGERERIVCCVPLVTSFYPTMSTLNSTVRFAFFILEKACWYFMHIHIRLWSYNMAYALFFFLLYVNSIASWPDFVEWEYNGKRFQRVYESIERQRRNKWCARRLIKR